MPTKYRVETGPDAEHDITSIRQHIARDSPQAAARWAREIRRKVLSLASFPERCEIIPEAPDLVRNYRHLIFGNYRILFRIEGRRVVVVRVIHAARRLHQSMFPLS